MISTIVIGFDGSRTAGRALDTAIEMVRARSSRLHVVSAYQRQPLVTGQLPGEYLAPIGSSSRADSALSDAQARARVAGSTSTPISSPDTLPTPSSMSPTTSRPTSSWWARVVDTIEAIVARHRSERAAAVCHGGVINTYFAHVLGLGAQNSFFYPNYTSIHRVAAARSGERLIVTINETAHLRGTGLPIGLFQR